MKKANIYCVPFHPSPFPEGEGESGIAVSLTLLVGFGVFLGSLVLTAYTIATRSRMLALTALLSTVADSAANSGASVFRVSGK